MSKLGIGIIVMLGILVIGSFYGINQIINNRVQVIEIPTSSQKTIESVTKEMGATHLNIENKFSKNIEGLQE